MTYVDALVALADPTRRGIFEALRDRAMTVTELAQSQPVSRPAVSQHLKILEGARLVAAESRGSFRLYSIRRDGLEELRHYLDSFWSDVLGAYGDHLTALNKGN